MDERARFAAICAEEYGATDATLTPLSSSPGAIKHSFLVEQPGITPRTLHAYREAWLEVVAPREALDGRVDGLAALLDFLGERDFAAPRLVRTMAGASTVRCGEWCALVTAFVPGEAVDDTPANLRDLGAAVGHLHQLAPATAPDSWWALDTTVPATLERLVAGAGAVPPAWSDWYDDCRRALEEAVRWAHLPRALIHADAWLGNALRSADGRLALIDWECAGLGPAVLDLGSLVLHAHYAVPDYRPDSVRMATLLDGYRAQRRPTRDEVAVLPRAVQFGPAFRSALFFFRAEQRGWDEWVERHLTRERARFAPSVALGRAAQEALSFG